MRLFKIIMPFLILTLFSFIIILSEAKSDISLQKFISTFEQSEAKFDFFELKSSIIVYKDVNVNSAEDICEEIVKKLNIDKNKLNVNKNNNTIYVNYNSKNMAILITGVEKNNDEIYILVDILENKVYKNIENNYYLLKNVMSQYSKDVEMNICIAGEYQKTLQNIKKDDILNEILYNMYAKEIDRIEDENFMSVNAYSNLLSENNIKYFNKEINLNIGFRYSEDEDRTRFYMATPIIKIDY